MALAFAGFMSLVLLVFCSCSANGDYPDIISTASPLLPYGIPVGDYPVDAVNGQTIDLSTFNITFIGFNYSHLFISPDGTVGFEKAVNYLDDVKYSAGVRNPGDDVPFLAPLLFKAHRYRGSQAGEHENKISYRVVDYRDHKTSIEAANKVTYDYLTHYLSESVINSPQQVGVQFAVFITWANMSETPCPAGSICNGTTFQVVLVGDYSNTYAIFNYEKYDISVKDNYEAGFNAGRSRGWYNVLPCHGGCAKYISTSAIKDLPNFQGSNRKGRYIFRIGDETVTRGGCLDSRLVSAILEVYPRTVGMFGGEKLEVSGLCGVPNTKIYCRFGTVSSSNSSVVEGVMVNTMKGYCPVPRLTTIGRLDVYWSIDSKKLAADQNINVVLPSRMGDPFVVDQAVKDAWYSRDAKEIIVKWDPIKFSKNVTATVDIKLIGYKEYTDRVEYRELKNFGTALNSKGLYTINVNLDQNRCTANCEEFEIGLLEVSLSTQYHNTSTARLAARFDPIPLGWYVNQELVKQRGSDWSNQKCREWHGADSRDTRWIKDLLPCPCSLDQALADFGRWQADPGCNIATGSQCHYHKGAKHCVRSFIPTNGGAGNQCCYNNDGTLRYSQISYEGSTPDRSHAWGAAPYNIPDRVPELSHWKHDVISFYYCCLWNNYELCDLYMEQRPTADCRNYNVPSIGYIHGHTHMTTFDGLSYHFAGSGDFWLARDEVTSLIIQGKFQPREQSWDFGKLLRISSWKPKTLIALAISSGKHKIEVTLVPEAAHQRRKLDIKVDGELRYFLDKDSFWQDFADFAVTNNALSVTNNDHGNFSFLLTTFHVGINVAAVNGLLHVVVVVPPTYKQPGRVVGLLGAYDGDANNDYRPRDGNEFILPTADKRSIFDRFVLSWKLRKDDYGIFKFEDTTTEIVNPTFLYFEYNQIPANFSGAPNHATVNQFCGVSENCKYDYQITGEQNIAKATKDADVALGQLQRSAYLVKNCGLPSVGSNVVFSSENFSVGRDVQVSKCRNGDPLDKPVTFRCVGSDQPGQPITNLHWDPQPYTVCAVNKGGGDSSDLALIIGVSVGAVVVIIIIVVVIFIVFKKRRSGKASTKETRTPAERGKKTAQHDPAAADAMLSHVEERSPVYKPSREPMRMSELEGSKV